MGFILCRGILLAQHMVNRTNTLATYNEWNTLVHYAKNVMVKELHLTLEQHRFELHGFFPINTVPVFSFYGSLNVGKVCVWLKSQYAVWFSPDCFSFLPFGEPLISLFVFEAEIVVCGFLTEVLGGGVSTPTLVLIKGQLYYAVIGWSIL